MKSGCCSLGVCPVPRNQVASRCRVLLLENEKRLLLSRLDSSSTAAGATQDAQDAGALQKSLAAAREELSAQKRTAQALQQELLRVRTQTEDEASTLQSRYAAMKQALEAQVRYNMSSICHD